MTRLGKYELQEEIGRGGFATVYRATHISLGSEAAVKVLDVSRLSDLRARERMEREARIASGLTHPHIVTIFDLIHEGETLAIAMEYLREGNLRQWIQKNQPDTPPISHPSNKVEPGVSGYRKISPIPPPCSICSARRRKLSITSTASATRATARCCTATLNPKISCSTATR